MESLPHEGEQEPTTEELFDYISGWSNEENAKRIERLAMIDEEFRAKLAFARMCASELQTGESNGGGLVDKTEE